MVQVSLLQHIRSGYVVRTEADTASHHRVDFRDRADIFRQKMCNRGFTDQHMHTFPNLLHNFFVVIAFMVQTDAAAEITV